MTSQIFWFQRHHALQAVPCLFLDRDGVVVEEVDYLCRTEDIQIVPGIARLMAQARAKGWAVGLVTNQSGIGRGRYDWAAFAAVQAEIVAKLLLGPEPFDFVAACSAHPDATIKGLRIDDHLWRKQRTGMLDMAAAALKLDMAPSVLVGDKESDLVAGLDAGIGLNIHILNGHGSKHRQAATDLVSRYGSERVALVSSLAEVPHLLGWGGAAHSH